MIKYLAFYFAFLSSIVASADCNIWVDKVQATLGSHAVTQITTWVKVADLDSPVKYVGFHSQIVKTERARVFCSFNPETRDCSDLGVWMDRPAEAFFSQNYWQLSLLISSDYNFSRQYEGVFFVETENGTRYYAKSAIDNGNFFIDTATANDLFRISGTRTSVDVEKAVATKVGFSYLNPSGCQ